jgi:hypothetical protein
LSNKKKGKSRVMNVSSEKGEEDNELDKVDAKQK